MQEICSKDADQSLAWHPPLVNLHGLQLACLVRHFDEANLSGQLAENAHSTAAHCTTVIKQGSRNILLNPHLKPERDKPPGHTAWHTGRLPHVLGHLRGQTALAERPTQTDAHVVTARTHSSTPVSGHLDVLLPGLIHHYSGIRT